MYHKKYHIHFVGIGGIGMSGIAELLINLGYAVSGSDLQLSDITSRLEKLGGSIYQGHAEANIQDADVVVTSSAVKHSNPEVLAAEQLAIPVIPRAEMLAELMRLKYSIAIAGAHGKTSTTSIVSTVLAQGGLDPTVVIGGKLKSIGSNALLGQGDFIVAEADESDGSFLKMSPAIAVVTNIDREHLDFYADITAIKDAFLEFLQRVPFYGLGVVCLDNEHIQELIPAIKKRFITYGISSQAYVRPEISVLRDSKADLIRISAEKRWGKFISTCLATTASPTPWQELPWDSNWIFPFPSSRRLLKKQKVSRDGWKSKVSRTALPWWMIMGTTLQRSRPHSRH